MATILWDGFETIIFPRRVTRKARLTRLFYRYSWVVWSKAVNVLSSKKRSETYLSFYGPLSLLFLLVIWAVTLVIGFALLHWATGSAQSIVGVGKSFWDYLYFSGSNFFTLGIGDVTPQTLSGKVLTVIEAGLGLGFLALIIGYLPALNQSFASREETISLLDARAGSPPTAMEMLKRHNHENGLQDLGQFLNLWERWSSELLESHLSYPVLAFFRSQHKNQSWLAALTAILHTTSLVMAYLTGPCKKQAGLTFAMARHAVVDLSIVFDSPPCELSVDRLPPGDLDKIKSILSAFGYIPSNDGKEDHKLLDLRRMYEPYLYSLGNHLGLTMPPWIPKSDHLDNWMTNPWETITSHSTKAGGARRRHKHF